MKNQKWWLFCLCYLFIVPIFAQANPSSQLYHKLLRFQETKRILFVAAHPDDENTRLIAYLANAEHAEVAYLSLTRGDGGQNLIGSELGIELGMIRTQELLRARETDGGRQFFTRALDFGFSKNPDETFNNWDKKKLLSDVVWIIRKYQPDVILNRFNTIPGTTHGHHTSSAMLSVEAFELAADKNAFPEQLKYVSVWQPKSVFWNAYNWGGQYEPEEGKTYHKFLVGEYNPLLGTTYSKIAADSRTMHKSQGFGSTSQIGQGNDFIELIKGSPFKSHPFEGIESRWNELPNGAEITKSIEAVLSSFDFIQPENNLEGLLKIKTLLDTQKSTAVWLTEKKVLLDGLILETLGIKGEFNIKKEIGYPGEKINTEFVINNPAQSVVKVISFDGALFKAEIAKEINANIPVTVPIEILIPQDYPVSQPFWLEKPLDGALFNITEPEKIGKPNNSPGIYGVVTMEIGSQKIRMELPLQYKYNDQVDGEIKQPFTLVPEVNVHLDKANLFLVEGAEHKLHVEVSFRDKILEGELMLKGLSPSQYRIVSADRDDRRKRTLYTIDILDSDQEKKQVMVTFRSKDGREFNLDTKRISYKHIPNLTYFTSTSFGLVKTDMKVSGQKIGYINGAGDDVAEVLKNLGYQVSILEDSDIQKDRLKAFSTVIVGIRAFNVNQALASNVDQLMEYVKEGGNVIVQYNTGSPLLTKDLGPYPFVISRERVTVENSPIQVDYSHPVLAGPNKITAKDFEGWVQERGLYFTADWDPNYSAPIAFQDPGEKFFGGSLIHTKYGAGTYTYSSISWFRQLPAGVPGAVKLFVNLIEQGK
ncbi:PIG-L family deacetylase [Cognataquiflexum rubidum]|uniref:PIG-L family deacetylase n=1 Tax=Cognataquiflexum rubidum TaxID=2922273 RepID=UPI001F12C617|nr:PIG-L family deacetylase [Cognataquiflexum rubidum]MCH6235680.1 PIG-L family deacetylase [Cognataquiflexum rubidum]